MAKVYNKMQIDVNSRPTSMITAVQRDAKSRYLDVVLLEGAMPIDLTGHEVRIYGRKADGKEFFNNGEITDPVAGRCQFELTDQALAVAQDLKTQIIIFRDNLEILSTQAFVIHVVSSLLSTGAVESSNEYGALVVLYQNLYEAYELMTTMVQQIGVPQEIAQGLSIDTMWEAWEFMCNYIKEDLTTLLTEAINNNSVDGVVRRIGETGDTGGSEIAGTLMGKSNALLSIAKSERDKSIFFKRVTRQITLPAYGAKPIEHVFEFGGNVNFISFLASVPGYGSSCGVFVTFYFDGGEAITFGDYIIGGTDNYVHFLDFCGSLNKHITTNAVAMPGQKFPLLNVKCNKIKIVGNPHTSFTSQYTANITINYF